MRGRRDQRRAAGGFVTIEVLTALALGALIVLTLAVALGLVTRAWERAAAQAETLETVERGLAALGRDLATLRRIRRDGADGGFLFLGTPTAVGLVSRRLPPSPQAGDRLVLVEALEEDGTGRLLRRDAPLGAGAAGFDGAPFANPVALIAGPWRFRFAYADGSGAARRWLAAWSEPDRLPDAIRLDILDPTDGAARLPPLVVALRVAPVRCVSADEHPSCRRGETDGAEEDGAAAPPGAGAR